MRVLLDACVPRQLALEIAGHQVDSAVSLGWGALDDGPLLDAMEDRFDVFVTADRQLPVQQRISGRSFAVIVLRARTNRFADLQPLVSSMIQVLPRLRPGEFIEVSS